MTEHESPLLDLRGTDAETAGFLTDYFAAKSSHDPVATLEFFSPDALTYSDAPLGWATDGKAGIVAGFTAAMPQWRDGRSYPTAVLGSVRGGDGSAVVAFTNTPGIVGDELLRILAAVDVRAGQIVRWVDYWDTSGIDQAFRDQVRTPSASFPVTFREDQVAPLDPGVIGAAASALCSALASGDAEAAAALFDFDTTWDDVALRIRVVGRPAIERFFRATSGRLPMGAGSRLRHVVGRGGAGGVEWFGAPESGVLSGITALTLTATGGIASATSVYDGKLLAGDDREKLIAAATRP